MTEDVPRDSSGPRVSFRGVVGRRGCAIGSDDGELVLTSPGGRNERVRPSAAEWQQFWAVAESLRVWDWQREYGRLLKDGRPWQLELHDDARSIITTGNGYERHAPPGIRRLMLALHTLLKGQLIDDAELAALRRDHALTVSTIKQSRPPISDITLVRESATALVAALAARGVTLEVHAYTLGQERSGVTFLLDAPLAADALAAVKDCVIGDAPHIALFDFSSGTETVL